MTTAYLADETYRRLIDVVLESLGGTLMRDRRDDLMFAIGEGAGIWPESSRDDEAAT